MNNAWKIRPFEQCVQRVKYTNKVSSQDYKESGLFPIVSQEEEFISGYWDKPEDVFHVSSPLVIFGDHSRHLKYVDFDFVIGADGVKILLPTKDINAKFFFYYLRWLNIPSLGYSRHYKSLKEKTVPIPSNKEQLSIVSELNLLNSIIEKEKQQIADLDVLCHSLFLEMFGEPSVNEKRLPSAPISKYAKCIAGATPSTREKSYWDNGTIPWLSSGEVAKGRVYETDTLISKEGYDSCSTRLVPVNTVLVAMAGQGKTRGTVGISGIELCTNQSICSIVVKDSRLNPVFLYYQLKYLYKELRAVSNGDGGRGGLNLKIIGKFNVIVPPKKRQEEYVSRVNEIEHQKEVYKSSLSDTKNLFQNRLDFYFSK